MKVKWDYSKSLVDVALEKAEMYEKQGDKEKSKRFLEIAEKYEEIMKRNRHTLANRQILRK